MGNFYFLKKIVLILILVGGINWGLVGSFNLDLVKLITNNNILKKIMLDKIIYILIGLSALYACTYIFKRDNMLPFLGRTVYPCKSLALKTPKNHTKSVTINVEPDSKVVYWAAEPSSKNTTNGEITWKEAYKNYANSGVAMSNKNGVAILKFRNPQSYTVPYKKGILKPHVHYRVCSKNGMLSRIETVYI